MLRQLCEDRGATPGSPKKRLWQARATVQINLAGNIFLQTYELLCKYYTLSRRNGRNLRIVQVLQVVRDVDTKSATRMKSPRSVDRL